jgi:hypothetical protein
MIEGGPSHVPGYAGYQVLTLEPHLHTLHSDGQHGIREMFEACRQAGFDAVALTDHNTVSGLREAARIAEDLGLVFVPGVEVTTFRGHAVALGVRRTPEWRGNSFDAVAAEVHAEGGVLSVAHPAALGSPVCSGCAWDWAVEAGSIDLWEVFSAARPEAEVPLAHWRNWLARGARLAPVAAGDVHSTSAAARPRIPTRVHVRERSTEGVMEALRARRVIASADPAAGVWQEREVAGVCVYAEQRDADGTLVGVSAPTWIDSAH